MFTYRPWFSIWLNYILLIVGLVALVALPVAYGYGRGKEPFLLMLPALAIGNGIAAHFLLRKPSNQPRPTAFVCMVFEFYAIVAIIRYLPHWWI